MINVALLNIFVESINTVFICGILDISKEQHIYLYVITARQLYYASQTLYIITDICSKESEPNLIKSESIFKKTACKLDSNQ